MPGVAAWEDDPHSSSDAEPVGRPVPDLGHPRLGLSMVGRQPAARVHPAGTPGFRYWNAADALARAVGYWSRVVPGAARWHNGRPLVVDLDAGEDLNVYYDRQELCFFHATVRGVPVYSGESPDVLCHELGHALLDAVRPQLWNAASIEVAALHEAFGDISAMLSALDLPSVREDVLAGTGGRLSRASRVSRLAEQLGWAIRQLHPDAVDADCLRNAVNSFFYRQPESLPPMAPAERPVVGAAFVQPRVHGGVARVAGGNGRGPGTGGDALASAAFDAGRLLIGAVGTARIASNYFAQVAAGLLVADERLTRGSYRAAIRRAFVGRGILSMSSAADIVETRRRGEAATPSPRAARLRAIEVPIDGRAYGLRLRRLLVEAPLGSTRWTAASAALDLGPLAPATPDRASRAFVEDLLRRGRVDTGGLHRRATEPPRRGRTTHALVREGRRVRLVRQRFHARP